MATDIFEFVKEFYSDIGSEHDNEQGRDQYDILKFMLANVGWSIEKMYLVKSVLF